MERSFLSCFPSHPVTVTSLHRGYQFAVFSSKPFSAHSYTNMYIKQPRILFLKYEWDYISQKIFFQLTLCLGKFSTLVAIDLPLYF